MWQANGSQSSPESPPRRAGLFALETKHFGAKLKTGRDLILFHRYPWGNTPAWGVLKSVVDTHMDLYTQRGGCAP